jgi:N-acyl-L-homoserine lactone synthetase
VNEHFLNLTNGVAIRSPFIWECTRFCLAPDAESRIASALMLAGGELMRAFDLSHFVGVFDAHMTRVYRIIGALPEVLGTSGHGRGAISVGLWSYDASVRDALLARAGITSDLSEHWFERSFGHPVALDMAG